MEENNGNFPTFLEELLLILLTTYRQSATLRSAHLNCCCYDLFWDREVAFF